MNPAGMSLNGPRSHRPAAAGGDRVAARILNLPVAVELIEEASRWLPLILPGNEVDRHDSGDGTVLLRWAMPDPPDGATTMSPSFTHHYDSDTVSLAGIDYFDALGTRINCPT